MTPNVITHNILAGGPITGVSPDGVETPATHAAPSFGGVMQSFQGCTVGGLFEFSKMSLRGGVTISAVAFEGAGTTAFSLDVIATGHPNSDNSIAEHRALSSGVARFTEFNSSTQTFYHVFERPVLVPPGYDVRFVTVGNLTGPARLTLMVGPGLGAPSGFVQVQSN